MVNPVEYPTITIPEITETLLGFRHYFVKVDFAFVAAGPDTARNSALYMFDDHLNQGKDFARAVTNQVPSSVDAS